MPFVGSIIPANIVRVDAGVRKAQRDREDKKRPEGEGSFSRALDEAELHSVERVEQPEAPQAAPPPESELSREDREKHGYYDPSGPIATPPRERKIDLSG
jgi:hypothetical protein